MREQSQKERLERLIKRPVPKKKVGIVRLEMVKESRYLYGKKKIPEAGRSGRYDKAAVKASGSGNAGGSGLK